MSRWLGLVILAAAALALGTAVGPSSVRVIDVMRALAGQGDPAVLAIVRDLRLPRALLAFLVGGSLAVSGASLQASKLLSVTRAGMTVTPSSRIRHAPFEDVCENNSTECAGQG